MKKIYGRTACLADGGTNYCPGCGHGLIQKLCLEVVEEMGLMEQAVFAASVGCHGMAPVYVNIDAFNAQHGRIPSNAEAFKACSPDSILLVYQGDGDAVSIGMNETVNTAYRGAPLTVIMANNSNFGMTGGQLAPTTLHGAITKTTKYGNPYYPIRTAELVATLEAPDIMTGCRYAEMEVERHACNMPCLTYRPDLYVRRIKEITDAVHSYGAKIFYQIGAGMGRNNLPQDDRRFNVAASVTTNYFDPTVVHRELTNDEVYKLIRNFGKAAKVAKDGGADGIEIHSIHGGYLLDSFTMASYNHRTDEFGGDAKARALFPILLMQEVKKQCGDDFPVSIRFAVKSFIRGSHLSALPGHSFKELGRDCIESLELAQILDEAGYDCFNVDCGSYDGDFWGKPPAYMPAGPYLQYSKMVKDIVHVPVMVSGKLGDPNVALKAVTDGDTDMVALGRPLLADPDLVNKVKRGDIDDIRRCLTCNEGCLNRMATQNRKSSCAINPCANREEITHLHPTTNPKKILVVGAGPTGMEVARVLSTRGHKVTVVERDDVIGGRFRFAAVPSFKHEDRQLIDWYGRQLEKLDVDLRLKYELKLEDKLIDDSDVIITATGANSIVPKLPGINYAVNALDLLAGKEKVGGECTVIGGGLVGLEVIMWLGSQGVKCRLIEMAPKLCYSAPPAKQSMQMIEEYLREYNVDIHLSTKLCEVTDHSVIVENSEGTRVEYETEKAVLAIGFLSENTLYKELLQTNKEVYNIGDSRYSSNVANGIFDAYELGQHLY